MLLYELERKPQMTASQAFGQGEPERCPAVGNQMAILEKELAMMGDRLDTLEVRLSPALSMEPPNPGKEGACGPSEPTAPLASALWHLGRRIAVRTSQLDAILRRLEL
jgi:hypothetical protein